MFDGRNLLINIPLVLWPTEVVEVALTERVGIELGVAGLRSATGRFLPAEIDEEDVVE